jgi:hypothetical protein
MTRPVYDEDEISSVLKVHIFIERVLETLISNNLTIPYSLFRRRRSFELKNDLTLTMVL